MSYGRSYPMAYPAELARLERERLRKQGPRKPYVAPPPPRVSRVGLTVRLSVGARVASHRYPSAFLANRMEHTLRADSAARRRFLSKYGAGGAK